MEEEIKAKVEKEQAKRDQAAEKARVKSLHSDSTKIFSKIGGLVTDLMKVCSHKSYSMIPVAMQKRYTDALTKLEEMKTVANERLQGDTSPLGFSMKDVQDAHKTGIRDPTCMKL